MSKPQARSAIKFDLFADAARKQKIETLGDPLQVIARHIDFDHLTQVIDQLLPRGDASRGGRPPYPTAVMVRILVLKYLYNLSDEQMEYQLLDRMSYQRFCLLTDSANVPDRNTLWHYQQRLGVDGVTALFQAVDAQLLQRGYLARCGQIIDATLVPAPIQHFTKEDKEQLGQGNIPSDWSAAKRRQKDLDATHTKKHGKGYHGYKLSISVDVRHKFIRKIATGTASEHDSSGPRIGGNGVKVPTYLYKLVYDATDKRAWAHWQENREGETVSRPISYQELVKRTGVEFLPKSALQH